MKFGGIGGQASLTTQRAAKPDYFYMESKPSSGNKGSNCHDKEEAEHVPELLDEHDASICKHSKNYLTNLANYIDRYKAQNPQVPHGSRKSRIKTEDTRKKLIEMLNRSIEMQNHSQVIMLKVNRLRLQLELLLDDVYADM